MESADDPFERAIQRERRLRNRAMTFESGSGVMRIAIVWLAALAVGWTVLLTLHWLLLPDPRWLAVLHTVAFALVVGYWVAMLTFMFWMKRSRPDLFGDE